MNRIFSPNKLLTYYNEYNEIKRGGIPFPRTLLFYPSMSCNQKCNYCFYLENHGKKQFTPKEKVVELLNNSHDLGCRGFELSGGGEPLLHPNIEEIIRHAKSIGFKIGIVTHGAIKRAKLFEEIAKSCSWIRFSVDYADPIKYANNRNTNERDLQFVLDNIKYVACNKNSDLSVVVKMTLFNQARLDLCRLIDYCIDCGVDVFQIKLVDLFESDDGISEMANEVINCYSGTTRMKFVFDPTRTILKGNCWATPMTLFVDTYGDVLLCCYYNKRHQQHKIGNVFESRLLEIWGSEKHLSAISMIDGDICNKYVCRYIRRMDHLDNVFSDKYLQAEFL